MQNVNSMHSQSGAILVVSLILLFIVTVVGLSTVGSTSLGVQMAANDQFKNRVFQESENAIEDTLADLTVFGTSYGASLAATPTWPSRDVSTAVASNQYMGSSAQVRFAGFATPEGDSAGSIRLGASGYSLYNYEVEATATMSQSGASNTNVRGAYVLGARPN